MDAKYNNKAEGELKELLLQLTLKETRARNRSMIYIAIPILVGGLWLLFSLYQVRGLKEESQRLGNQIQESSKELEQKKQEIEKSKEILLALYPMLKEFGWSQQTLTREAMKSDLVELSLKANNELQKMSSTNVDRRQGITIQYYIKKLDASIYVNGNKVEEALKGLGFKVEIKSPLLPDIATNAVVFGSSVNPDDAKLVAYSLIRAGIEVRAIYKARGAYKPFVIQVVGATFLTDRPSLTVEQVRDTTEFPFPLTSANLKEDSN